MGGVTNMDAVEFLKEKYRMCDYTFKKKGNCSKCRLYKDNTGKNLSCEDYINKYPKKAVAKVENWSKSHPHKTVLDDFREKYPNAIYTADNTPSVCAKTLGYIKKCDKYFTCEECWNSPLEEVE